MSRRSTRPLVVLALLVPGGTSRTSASTIYVDPLLAVPICATYAPGTRSCGSGSDLAYDRLAPLRAAAATAPGDTVFLREGTYLEALVPGTSGSPGSPITFQGYPGEIPLITGSTLDPALDLSGRRHLVLRGLRVADVIGWLRADDAHDNQIEDCTFLRATANGSRAGVKFVNATYNRFRNNVLDDGNDNLQFIHSDRNLAEGNRLTRARHNLWDILCGSFNVIRGNDFDNELQKIGQVTDCEGVPADATPAYDATKRNLIEGNRFRTTPSSGNASPYAGIQYSAQQGIVRRNVFSGSVGPALDLTLYADEARFNTENRVYHNVFHGTSFAGVSLAPALAGAAFSGNLFRNNVSDASRFVANDTRWPWYTAELSGQAVQLLTGRLDGFAFERNAFFGGTPDGPYTVTYGQRTNPANPPPRTLPVWEASYPALFLGNREVAPSFVSPASGDFRLAPGSPLIDAGTFLTTTAAAGSGTVLPVADAGYFYDGFSIPGESGDRIQLEGQTQTARVLAADYVNNTLTLDRSLSWSVAQGVALAYRGPAPDIGAFEACLPLPGRVTGVTAVRLGGAVRLDWDLATDPGSDAYDVWKVVDGAKPSIPLANRANAGSGIVAVAACTAIPAATPSCSDPGAVAAAPSLVFYQVRGACSDGTEGTGHP